MIFLIKRLAFKSFSYNAVAQLSRDWHGQHLPSDLNFPFNIGDYPFRDQFELVIIKNEVNGSSDSKFLKLYVALFSVISDVQEEISHLLVHLDS